MKKALTISFLLLAPALQVRAQTFTAAEQVIINSCVTNISAKSYSPEKADKCLAELNGADNDFTLLEKLKAADEPKARYILTNENAIKDLGDFFRDADSEDVIRGGLIVRLEKTPCVLCALELGPQPDKLLPWIAKYAADKTTMAKRASQAWDSLRQETRDALSEDGMTPEDWAARTLSWREEFIWKWSQKKFNEILPPGAVRLDAAKHARTIRAILPYLDGEQRDRITAALKGVKEDLEKAKAQPGAANNAATAASYGNTQARINTLAGQNNLNPFLNSTFDNAVPGAGNAGAPGPGPRISALPPARAAAQTYALTDAEAARIAPRMQKALLGSGKDPGEISDTAVGREAIVFYSKPENPLKFNVARLSAGTEGEFLPYEGTITISKAYVEKAMKQTGVTAAQLLDEGNGAAMKKVTRVIAPTFIHEGAGHQVQAAWSRDNDLPFNYNLTHETGAFSKSGLYVLQKEQAERAKGNPNYSAQIHESDVQMARLLKKEGVEGVRKAIMYYEIASQQGKAAQNFAQYEGLKTELTRREEATKTDPEKEKLADSRRADYWSTSTLKKKLNAFYPWYKLSVKRSAEETRYYQDQLAEIKDTGGRSTTIGTKPVAELSED